MRKSSDNSSKGVSRRAAMIVGTVGVGAGLAGCYEDPQITVHEPGKYKGQQDSLGDGASREQALQARFSAGQVDR